MPRLSTQEVAQLGKAIGASMREQYGDLIKDEKTMKEVIQKEFREILRKSEGRGAPWMVEEINPMDVVTIEKNLHTPVGEDETRKQLQEWNDDLYIVCKCSSKAPHELDSFEHFKSRWSELAKALNTATAGEGLGWIPTGMSRDMIEMVELEANVASQFDRLDMPTDPFEMPALLGHGTAYRGGEPTTDSPDMFKTSTPRTGKKTFSTKMILANYPITKIMTEDAAIAMLPLLKQDIGETCARGLDDAILNGDTSDAIIDTGEGTAYSTEHVRSCWNGLRALCQSDLKQSASGWTASTGLGLIRSLRADMKKYAVRKKNLRLFAGTNMNEHLIGIDEVSTVDKMGGIATILKGELTALDAMPIVLTEDLEERQNTSGIYDASTETDTQLLLVYVKGFKRGYRRDFTLDYEEVKRKGISYLIATMRVDWKALYDTDTEPMIGWLYNITL